MDTIIEYQNSIKQIFSDYVRFLNMPPIPPYKVIVAFDDIHQQYLLRKIGWVDKHWFNKTILHIAIYDKKIWVEEDWTEDGIAGLLIKNGIAKDDIILGFQPPQLRAISKQMEELNQ